MESRIFETLSPTRFFFRCAIPAMIGMAVSACYSIADGAFVGHFIGEDALAAVNLIMPLAMIAFALADMIAAGSSVRVSLLLGQKDRNGANGTFTFCLKTIFLMSVVVAVPGFAFAGPALELMGVRGMALSYGIEYIRVYAIFAPFIMPFFVTDNYLRICGRENYSMGLNVITSLLNILLDYLLIVVWKQGVWAAAFASCISMTLGTVLSLLPFLGKRLDLRFEKGTIPIRQFVKLLVNGSSEFFSSIAGSILVVIVNVILVAVGGTTAVAAFSVVMYVESIVGTLIFGMISALQPAISLLGTLVFPCACLAVLVPSWGLDGVWLMPFGAGMLSAATAVVAVVTLKRNV